jgi:hypothetical protein
MKTRPPSPPRKKPRPSSSIRLRRSRPLSEVGGRGCFCLAGLGLKISRWNSLEEIMLRCPAREND